MLPLDLKYNLNILKFNMCILLLLVLFIYCSIVDVMVRVWVGKEFPDMRQDERRIEFISMGDAARTAAWLKGELTRFSG